MEKLSELKLKEIKSGLYKIYNKDKEVIYIGKSYNLKKRLYHQCRYNFYAKYVSIMLIENKETIDLLEYKLINKYKPSLNKDYTSIFNTFISKNFNKIEVQENFSELIYINIPQTILGCSYRIIKEKDSEKVILIYHSDILNEEINIPDDMYIDDIIIDKSQAMQTIYRNKELDEIRKVIDDFYENKRRETYLKNKKQ